MKSKIVALTAATYFIAMNASAGAAWTVTTTGTLSGLDRLGVFTSAGERLDNADYTLSLTTTIDPADWKEGRDSASGSHEFFGTGNPFTTQMTVNGKTVTFEAVNNTNGKQTLVDYRPDYGQPDTIRSLQSGYTADGHFVYLDIYIEAFQQDILHSVEFDQPVSATLAPSAHAEIEFHFGPDNSFYYDTYFGGRANTVAITATDVPEPASLALFGLGLLGVTAYRRRAAWLASPAAPSRGDSPESPT